MPTKKSLEIKNAREMEMLLRRLGPKVATRVGQSGTNAGMRVIVNAAKAIVQKKTRALERAITVRVDPKAKRLAASRGSLLAFEKPESRRAHLTEFGTSHSRAFPFVRPAMDMEGQTALDRMSENIGIGLANEAEKLAGTLTKPQRQTRAPRFTYVKADDE